MGQAGHHCSRRAQRVMRSPIVSRSTFWSSFDVRSGPGDTNPQLVEIREGLKVTVLAARDEWLQVTSPDGITGWIRAEYAEDV